VLAAVVNDKSTQLKNAEGEISEIIVPFSTDFGTRPFSLRYFISYESIYENINKSIQTTLIFVIIIFLVSLGTTTLLVNRSILSPLGKIVAIAHEIRGGNLSKEIVINTKDELNDLATSLNQMTQSLRKNIEDLKEVDKLKNEFIMIASHNLRTPLTVIKGYVPFLRDKKLDKDMEEVVDGIEVSTQKLEVITQSLLDIVALEGDSQPLKKTPEDLVQLVKEVLEAQKPAAEKKKVSVNPLLPTQPLNLQIDEARIKMAITNIIDNAIKFNKENGKVDVKLEVVGNKANLSVEDTGVGISPEEQQKMFQKFHRGTDVLTYNYEGLGLSLYTTKVVIESHGGTISVASELGKGTKVVVTLPL